MIVYAAGYGIMWIARGTLPLALFGAERYPVLMGRLAFPSLIVQALAPFAAALVVERYGIDAMVAGLTVIAARQCGAGARVATIVPDLQASC